MPQPRHCNPGAADLDVLVVGAGFGGLYALHKLREDGFSVRVVEAGDDVGGTWYWNRYPGARCDVESLDYSFSLHDLQQEWVWSERYATQPEILAYLRFVADKLDLKRDITFETRVRSATWDGERAEWTVTTGAGGTIRCRHLILATGSLSAAKVPDIPGAGDFAGRTLNTSSWPPEGVDMTGLKVGVIGTGSSAIQAIPVLARTAARLTVFQRTPAFTIPARNQPLDPAHVAEFKRRYHEHREKTRGEGPGVIFRSTGKTAAELDTEAQREALEDQWIKGGADFAGTFTDLLLDESSNAVAAEFVRGKIRQIVKDRATAERLTPRGYALGAKRLCLDTDYYETFNRKNVELVDVKADPIQRIEAAGVRTGERLHELNVLVFATGFDAMTGAVLRIDIRGEGGEALKAQWEAGPQTYLGLMVAGFPNLFLVTGPGSPSVLTNMVASIEQHVDWIADCLHRLRDGGETRIEAEPQAQEAWVDRVNRMADKTLFVRGNANSWYLGANVPGKPRVFMPYVGGLGEYRKICERVAEEGYSGFTRR